MIEKPLSSARGWAIILVLAMAAMVGSLQFTLTVPVLPEIPSVLDISIGNAAWLIIATLLASTVTTPITSRLADLFGRKKLLLTALLLLFLGSVIAAVGMTFLTVIIGRVLQGFATSVVPIGVSLIHSHTAPYQANMGVALLSGTVGMGSALGFPLSGLLMESFGLSGIFWASAVSSLVFIIAVWTIVPEAPQRLSTSLDPWNALLLATWLTALMLLISKSSEWGWNAPQTVISSAMAVVGFSLWLATSLRNPNAVINLRLASRRMMLHINLASFLATLGMFTNHLMTIQEARAPVETGIGLALPVASAGMVLLPFALTMMLLTPVTGWSINRFGARKSLASGAMVMGLGYIFRILLHQDLTSIIIGTVIVGAGTSFAFAAMPALISQASPPSQVASANGVNSLVRSFSGAVASSAYALILLVFPSAIDPQFISRTGLMLAFGIVAFGCFLAAVVATLAVPKQQR